MELGQELSEGLMVSQLSICHVWCKIGFIIGALLGYSGGFWTAFGAHLELCCCVTFRVGHRINLNNSDSGSDSGSLFWIQLLSILDSDFFKR